MSNFTKTNNFFCNQLYPAIFNFAFYPTELFNYTGVNSQKRLADYTAKELAINLIVGVCVVLPLTLFLLDIAVDLFLIAAVAHIASGFLAAVSDMGSRLETQLA